MIGATPFQMQKSLECSLPKLEEHDCCRNTCTSLGREEERETEKNRTRKRTAKQHEQITKQKNKHRKNCTQKSSRKIYEHCSSGRIQKGVERKGLQRREKMTTRYYFVVICTRTCNHIISSCPLFSVHRHNNNISSNSLWSGEPETN